MSTTGRSRVRLPQRDARSPGGHAAGGLSAPAPRWLRVIAWIAAAAALVATFLAYQSPHMALDLANRLWACF